MSTVLLAINAAPDQPYLVPEVMPMHPTGHPDTFTLFRQWRADLARRRPPETARAYRRRVFDAGADLAAHPCEWGAVSLNRYLDGMHTASAKIVRQALADFTDWMVRKGHREHDPLAEVPPRRGQGRRLRRSLTADELSRLVIAAAWGRDGSRVGSSRAAVWRF